VRTLAFLLLTALAVLTFALHRAAGEAAAEPGDLRLSAIATELARRDVTIRCEGRSGKLLGLGGESGRTTFFGRDPDGTAFLQRGICESLHDYTRALKSGVACLLPCARPLEVAWSLNTLAHESYHLAGVRNEAETECYALQAIDFAARRLGAAPEQARAVADLALRQLPQRMPPGYRSPECRNGGKYDLLRDSAVWP
jgi:hypothetical protein